jgi:ABC-type transporter Mla MlaB component
MTLKIDRSARQASTVFVLSGRLEAEHIEELEALFELQKDTPTIVLDLREIRLADRGAVKFLARCETSGVKLENCPAYIREWIGKEKD